MDKLATRKIILEAKEKWSLSDAEMARLLVGDKGRGPRSTYEKWVKPTDSAELKKASNSAMRHIKTLNTLFEESPSLFDRIIREIRSTR